MPKKLATNLTPEVVALISRHPTGIAATEIAEHFRRQASPRTIGRVLTRLVRQTRIRMQGIRRGVRYLPVPAQINYVASPPPPQEQREVYVPLTGDAPMLRDRVRRPIPLRRPVGYDRALLDAYEPNRTFYLPDTDWRARLREIARAPAAAQGAGTYARDILNRLLIDLSWASSNLEGNTYSRLDTQNLIEHGRVAEGKDRLETQMILNHKQAIEFLVNQAPETGFDRYTFMNLHALLSQNLLGDPVDEGRLRSRIVDIGGTVYRPLQVPQQIEELFDLILEKAGRIEDPFEQSIFVMVHIPYLQPFVDVNKRVSRLAANIPFIKANLSPLSFVDVPERAYVEATLAVYEHARVDLLRDVFVWAYERSCESFKAIADALPDPDPFRLKFRAELRQAIAQLIRAARETSASDATALAATLVPADDRPRFEQMLVSELRNLHEGNIARYGLRLGEFRAWRGLRPKR